MRQLLCAFLICACAVCVLDHDSRSVPQRNLTAVYRITISHDKEPIGCGTGFAISPRRVLSAGHLVIADATYALDIFDANGVFTRALPLHLICFNDADEKPDRDLSLFEADTDIPAWTPIRYGEVKPGQPCYTIGARYGESPYCIGWGSFAAKTCVVYPNLWLATIDSAPGNSGGPMFNADHRFIGILVRARPSVILFVSAQAVREFMK